MKWTVGQTIPGDFGTDSTSIADNEGKSIAVVSPEHASLIAAAPDMMDLLFKIHADMISNGSKDIATLMDIGLVLAKATGTVK
jgi:hypothetical protein